MESYIGIDYGGTKLLIGEVDGEGNLLSHMRFETGERNQRKIAEHLIRCLKTYKEQMPCQGQVRGAGIGIIGISNHQTGIWHSFNHESGEEIPLAPMVSKILDIPAAIDNDVRSGATAELLWGCGKYSRNFIYLSVGTGLAAGMIIDGKILRGANQNAGEIGHITVKGSADRICECGRRGCAELTASGRGISGNIRDCLGKYPTKLLFEGGEKAADAREVFRLAREGDPLCEKVADEAAQVLAEVIQNLVRVSDPDTVVLGGGIMQDEWFWKQTMGKLNPVTMRGVKNGVRISGLKPEWTGVIGAAAVGKLYCENKQA